jgi:hypothetical protein
MRDSFERLYRIARRLSPSRSNMTVVNISATISPTQRELYHFGNLKQVHFCGWFHGACVMRWPRCCVWLDIVGGSPISGTGPLWYLQILSDHYGLFGCWSSRGCVCRGTVGITGLARRCRMRWLMSVGTMDPRCRRPDHRRSNGTSRCCMIQMSPVAISWLEYQSRPWFDLRLYMWLRRMLQRWSVLQPISTAILLALSISRSWGSFPDTIKAKILLRLIDSKWLCCGIWDVHPRMRGRNANKNFAIGSYLNSITNNHQSRLWSVVSQD